MNATKKSLQSKLVNIYENPLHAVLWIPFNINLCRCTNPEDVLLIEKALEAEQEEHLSLSEQNKLRLACYSKREQLFFLFTALIPPVASGLMVIANYRLLLMHFEWDANGQQCGLWFWFKESPDYHSTWAASTLQSSIVMLIVDNTFQITQSETTGHSSFNYLPSTLYLVSLLHISDKPFIFSS